ncbi:hypothetical protein GCM10009740_09030 [Terrabacter terrae]|uniref:Uncharacterized protein n=1 Tax=Terrabacter terrae TaxID=318434 RepID=A0ABP5FCQ7_9MICO
MVSTPRHPTGEGDGLACVVGTKSAGLVSAEHGGSFRDVGRVARAAQPAYGGHWAKPGARRRSATGTEDQS